DHEIVESLALLDAEVADVALLLEEARDLLLHARGRHRRGFLQRLVGVADPGEHVGNGIGQHRVSSYQELLVMPGMTPWWARSRRQIRQSPHFLKTARGRPHRLQREYFRVLNRCGRAAFAIIDFFAITRSPFSLRRRGGRA